MAAAGSMEAITTGSLELEEEEGGSRFGPRLSQHQRLVACAGLENDPMRAQHADDKKERPPDRWA